MKLGYARVSTIDQNLERQIDALTNAGCKIIYQEKKTGKNANRPELQKMLDAAKEGDIIVVQKLDRLGRSLQDLIRIVTDLGARNIGFVSLNDSFDTTSAQGRLVFHIMGALAEFERELIVDRVNDGLKNARKNGKTPGKPKKLNADGRILFEHAVKEGKSISEMQLKFQMSRPSVYRYLNEFGLFQTHQQKQIERYGA